MKKYFVAVLVAILLVPLCFASKVPAGDQEKILLFVQKDLLPAVNQLGFDKGYRFFLDNLKGEHYVKFYFFIQNDYQMVQDGMANTCNWPLEQVTFGLPIPSTTPYKNLLRFLKENQLRKQTVFFVSNGSSQDMLQLVDTEGFLQGPDTFTPTSYQPAKELKKYCRKNQIRLIGLLVPTTRRSPRGNEQIYLTTFRYVVEESGGIAYYNFNTFTGVFTAILKKEFGNK